MIGNQKSAIFDTVLKITKERIEAWIQEKSLRIHEVTLIRDVFGHVSVLIESETSAQDGQDKAVISQEDIEALKVELKSALKEFFSGTIYHKPKANAGDLEKAVIGEIESLRYENQQFSSDQNISWYLLERGFAKKAWLDQGGRWNAVWEYDEACEGKEPKVVSFYSFKGGMGRTTALVATAILLAKQGKSVLMVDTDIEAPGVADIFFDQNTLQYGTVDFFVNHQALANYQADMQQYILEVTDATLKEDLSGELYVIPAGRTDEHYLSKLARIDYQDMIPDGMRDTVTRLMKDAVKFLKEHGKAIDYVLLDARAGFHDLGGVVTFQIPHGIVLVGRNNEQSWTGIKEAVTLAGTAQKEPVPIVLLDSMCGVISSLATDQRDLFKKRAYTLCCDSYYPEEQQPGPDAEDEAHTPVYIPYRQVLNEEVQLYSDSSLEQDRALREQKAVLCEGEYQELLRRIALWFGDT